MNKSIKPQRDKNGKFIKGHSVSKEIKIKISEANKGKHYSSKTEFKKGKDPWNKGLVGIYSKETLNKMSESKKGNKNMLCKKHTIKSKRKMSISQKENYKKNPDRAKMFKILRGKLKFPFKDSSIELKIQDFLTILKIEFLTHKYMNLKNSYQCDIFIPIQDGINKKTIIECDGDFFHMNPEKYSPEYKIFGKGMTAKERWKLDNSRTKELLEKGYNVIRIWESEIKIMTLDNFKNKLEIMER